MTFVSSIPRCIQLVHEEGHGRVPVPDATIANIAAGMFLFFLAGQLPYSDDANIEKMARAFQAMWAIIHRVGGDEAGARHWFQAFNEGLLESNSPPNRIAITTSATRQRLSFTAEADCPLDILPHTISGSMNALKKVKLT